MIHEKEKRSDDVAGEVDAFRWAWVGIDAGALAVIEEDRATRRVFLEDVTRACERRSHVVLKLWPHAGGGTAAGVVSFVDSRKIVINSVEIDVANVADGWVIE